ncbi:D-alanyl-D-alanine carboxypeptidase [Streptomyces oceani]|uniref:D-alanyl-D-alanine carboxypeptidase n=2 Tax=Streptomyces oceani TaxID=1075402 RepID=A0A1E7JVZ2_9ACTN|nr:D-alanyl-D-alanine carboxypeptidase [Streptomyces oceani]
MRRWGISLGAVAATGAVLVAVTPAQAAGPEEVNAKGAYLMEGDGEELWGKGTDTRREMASTTKIMTATVALETKGALDEKVKIKQEYRDYVEREGGSTADLRTGDVLTVEQLLPALMLPSGCDAAYAIADTLGKGDTIKERTASFIGKMNRTAKQLELGDTKFDSFDGISQGGENYSTPKDLAKLAQHAMEKERFSSVVKSTKSVEEATNGRTYTWHNTNQLLGSYDGAIGIKTGTGTRAGSCLVFAVERDGRTVVGVVLGSDSTKKRYADAKKMLDWTFDTKSTMNLRELPEGAERD